MIRGLNPKHAGTLGISLDDDITSASLAIMTSEYKPISIFATSDDGSLEVHTHYVASPSIGDILSMKEFVKTIVKRMNPSDGCTCAYDMQQLKQTKYFAEHGKENAQDIQRFSLTELQSRLSSLNGILKKIANDTDQKELYDRYTTESLEIEREIEERKNLISSSEKELKKYPKDVPHTPEGLNDVTRCKHCQKQIPIPMSVVLFDDEVYNKLCLLILGVTLEEAGQQIPVSQLKFLWAYLIHWTFSVPSNLPTDFLAQISKAMNMIPLSDQMRDMVGIAENTENEVRSTISG